MSRPASSTAQPDLPSWPSLLREALECRDLGRLLALVRQTSQLEEAEGLPASHPPVRVALLGGASVDLLAGPLRLALLAHGLAPQMHIAPYNQITPELLFPGSATRRFEPQTAIVLLTPQNLPAWPGLDADAAAAQELALAACDAFLEPCVRLHEVSGADVVLTNLMPLPARPYGNLGARLPTDPNNFVRRVNLALGDRCPAFVHLVDVAALVEQHGLDQWFDPRLWYAAKQPVAPACLPALVHQLAAVAAAARGRSRKCLVVDLDNTLWGGVIGDDGLEGIVLGEGDAAGEAYKAFQQHLKRLQERGVILAVCSKNDEAIARLPFEQHPEMVLRTADFAAFKANWRPKSQNLRAIARELDLGLDALTFLDDNPAERAEVASALPEVLVPDLGSDAADFGRILDRSLSFETVEITGEDRQRSASYRLRNQAAQLREATADLGEFLRSLEMHATIRPLERMSLARATQLIHKTNQFNLTGWRAPRAEVEAMAESSDWLTRTVRLRDRFGDHGLVSVLLARVTADVLDIRGWVMSCRVLQRDVELLLLNELMAAAAARGCRSVRGTYVQSPRNGMVADLFPRLGFHPSTVEDGTTTWLLDVAGFTRRTHAIASDEHVMASGDAS